MDFLKWHQVASWVLPTCSPRSAHGITVGFLTPATFLLNSHISKSLHCLNTDAIFEGFIIIFLHVFYLNGSEIFCLFKNGELWKKSAITQERFGVGVQSCHFRVLQIGFILSSTLQLKWTLMEMKRLWLYSFPIYSLKQLRATLEGQVGNVTRWKWGCSPPKEQNETSGGVNNDSCLHSTFHLEAEKAASDKQRGELFHLLAKCSYLCSEMQRSACRFAACFMTHSCVLNIWLSSCTKEGMGFYAESWLIRYWPCG